MARRYFSTEAEDATKPVRVTAKKRGTITGRAGIFHFDPKGRDPLARSREVPPEVAEEARKKGLIEADGTSVDDGDDFQGSGSVYREDTGAHRISSVAASRRATSIQNDGEDTRVSEYFGVSGADTRDTTAFPADPSKSARVSPFRVITLGATPADEDDDADADGGDGTDGGEGEGGEDDDRIDAELDRLAPEQPLDDGTSQEGTAIGGDTPPVDEGDVADHAGSDQGAGGDATDDTGQANDQTDDETKTAAAQAGDSAPAAAPKPRRSRKPAGE